MVRISALSVLALVLVACGGSKGGKGSNVAGPTYSSLACEVGYYAPGDETLKIPTQPHLKQSAALVNGEALVETPKFETGGSRVRYAASRAADGKLALLVECGNSAVTHSFSATAAEVVGQVQCEDIALPEWLYFASTEERKNDPSPAWDSGSKVKSILVSCKVK